MIKKCDVSALKLASEHVAELKHRAREHHEVYTVNVQVKHDYDESELVNKHVVFDKDLRNKCRRLFLKKLKKVIILKSEIYKIIKIEEIEMVKQAKIEDIVIPIFKGENYSSWKIRLMMLLKYKQCKEPAERLKLDAEPEVEWKKI